MTRYCFTVPKCIFEDELPPTAFTLLVFLFSGSSFDGRCTISYDAMMHGIKASRDGVWKAFRLLRKRGWIYAVHKNGSRPSSFLLRIPPRLLGMDIQLKPGKIVVLPNQ